MNFRIKNIIVLLSSTLMLLSCKTTVSTSYLIEKDLAIYNNFLELNYLSNFRTSSSKSNDTIVSIYETLNLKGVYSNKKQTYFINDKPVHQITHRDSNKCSLAEIYKENFLLLTYGSCGAATPDHYNRDEVTLVDINSDKVYQFNFGEYFLTRSPYALRHFYKKSSKYYAIESIDLDSEIIKIINSNGEIKEFEITPYKT